MAAALKAELGLDTTFMIGDRGEFSIWIDDQKIAEKAAGRYPEPADVVAAARALPIP
ncbi:MAG TPA: hypothetical protein VLE97_09115 [Gaiellaceae bacterium]|nr:hypothetical protein [Gaiellaceae bacterium]